MDSSVSAISSHHNASIEEAAADQPHATHNGRRYSRVEQAEPQSGTSILSKIWRLAKLVLKGIALFFLVVLFTASRRSETRTTFHTPYTRQPRASSADWEEVPAEWMDTNPSFQAGSMAGRQAPEAEEGPSAVERLDTLTADKVETLFQQTAAVLTREPHPEGDSQYVHNARTALAETNSKIQGASTAEQHTIRLQFLKDLASFECPISLDAITHPVVTDCGHSFQADQLAELRKHDSRCPIDRAEITKVRVDTHAQALIELFAAMDQEPLDTAGVFDALVSILEAPAPQNGYSLEILQLQEELKQVQAQLAEASDKTQVQEAFIAKVKQIAKCPILNEISDDPVVAQPCGHLFDQYGIEQWRKSSNHCVHSDCRMEVEQLLPDESAKRIYELFQRAA